MREFEIILLQFANSMFMDKACLVPRRYVLFYGLRGLRVGRVDQFDSVFLPRVPSHVRLMT
jgi:hypothetical protein